MFRPERKHHAHRGKFEPGPTSAQASHEFGLCLSELWVACHRAFGNRLTSQHPDNHNKIQSFITGSAKGASVGDVGGDCATAKPFPDAPSRKQHQTIPISQTPPLFPRSISHPMCPNECKRLLRGTTNQRGKLEEADLNASTFRAPMTRVRFQNRNATSFRNTKAWRLETKPMDADKN